MCVRTRVRARCSPVLVVASVTAMNMKNMNWDKLLRGDISKGD